VLNSEEVIRTMLEDDKEFRSTFERNPNRKKFNARAKIGAIVEAAKKISDGSISSLKQFGKGISNLRLEEHSKSSYDERDIQFQYRKRTTIQGRKNSNLNPGSNNFELDFESPVQAEDENEPDEELKVDRSFRSRKSYRKGANIVKEVQFDAVKNFTVYFPHNNITKILLAMKEERLKLKKKDEIKNEVGVLTKILTKKFTSQLSQTEKNFDNKPETTPSTRTPKSKFSTYVGKKKDVQRSQSKSYEDFERKNTSRDSDRKVTTDILDKKEKSRDHLSKDKFPRQISPDEIAYNAIHISDDSL